MKQRAFAGCVVSLGYLAGCSEAPDSAGDQPATILVAADSRTPSRAITASVPSASAPPGASAPVDAILSNPLLAPGVTDVVQPAFFDDPSGDAGAAAADDAAVALPLPALDAGATLAGSGDLTVLLVFDKSSSMLFDWGGVTRWQVANESLRAALDPVLDVLTIGAIRFPLEETCGVPEYNSGSQISFTSGRNFVTVWQATEHRLESLGTPLGAALEVADRAITQAEIDGRLAQRFRVVLVTDGEPNCNEDPHHLAKLVADWYGRHVETVMIGLPGSEYAAALLNALAEAGGTGTFTATETARDLAGALGEAVQ